MSLGRSDFAEFFAMCHGGRTPFKWQARLLDSLLDAGQWPDRVVAPTGAGKTAAIDVHVFALALMAAGSGPCLPRRLAMVVDRRVLVDDQYTYAQDLAQILSVRPSGSEVVAEVVDLLWQLQLPDPSKRKAAVDTAGLSPLVTARLRGGLPPSRTWRDHPSAAAVLCGTPDMWGSRLLFRGYGSSSLAWPREAGLLAMDSVAVVDEAHLAQQLLCTARRVSQLAQVAEYPARWPVLQVVETTATPASLATSPTGGTVVGVEAEDLDEPVLSPRMTRPKPVELRTVKDWDGRRPRSAAVTALADAVVEQLREPAAMTGATHTVGCFANTVGRAVEVTAELRRRRFDERPLRVVTICGQVRPVDVRRVSAEHPGLLDTVGTSGVDVLVSTQSLEVGVDLDLAAVVTELASTVALAQRAGRVNRRGLRERGPIVVTMPEPASGQPGETSLLQAITDNTRSGPYGADELREAVSWLVDRAADPAGLSPWALRDHLPPVSTRRRVLYQRPELLDAWHWARTSEELAAEPELDLWLTEDFTPQTSVGIVVRDLMPLDATDAVRLVKDLPPRQHETFPVPYLTALAALTRLHQLQPDLTAVAVRGEDVDVFRWQEREATSDPRRRLRPGDIVVVDSRAEVFTSTGEGVAFSPPVVVPVHEGSSLDPLARADDVLHAQANLPQWAGSTDAVGALVLRIESTPPGAAFPPGIVPLDDSLSLDEELDDGQRHDALRGWLAALPDDASWSAMVREAVSLMSPGTKHVEVVVHHDGEEQLVRVLVLDRRRAGADEGVRQVWTPTNRTVTLDAHQQAVAVRAAQLARHLGLDAGLVDVLALAAKHHDDGKRDTRFQVRLGARDDTLLAKSRAGTTIEQMRRNDRCSGLPHSWRHEQRSVVEYWTAGSEDVPQTRQLVARLVGTSHGHGRSAFPHTAAELFGPVDDAALQEAATELFDLGDWDDLVEQTQRHYGVWGCAYLEAVLRAADGQVSQEGS